MNDCLEREFYSLPTVEVARNLIGMKLVRSLVRYGSKMRLAGIIVETEAYGGPDDGASHARMGPTSRNSVMFGEVGRAYVYFTYGNHYCVNVSAKSPRQQAGAVLIRALDPIEGLEVMRERRHSDDLYSIVSGPGKLTRALGITAAHKGLDLTDPESELCIELGTRPKKVVSTRRIGISQAIEKSWRFVDPSSRHLSRNVRIKVL